MAAISEYSASGDLYADGLLMGARWTSAELTYSFVQTAGSLGPGYGYGEADTHFKALTAAQQTAVVGVLADYAAVAGLSFVEAQGAAGDLRYGATGATPTAWAYNPHASAEGGDVWISSSGSLFARTAPGGYAYMTLLHETGHALGLKHANETDGGFGALPAAHDTLEYTVMSYNSYAGATASSGYHNGTWDYPQTLMLDDIRAIQQLYGARFDHVGESVVYRWDDKTGELAIDGVGQGKPGGDRIFMTVWTGGAAATYDFSNYADDLSVDLRPGEWSTVSTAQLARLDAYAATGPVLAAGNIANAYLVRQDGHDNLVANAVGGAGDDHMVGNEADNRLTGGAGNDRLDGGAGVDTAAYSGAAADYVWTHGEDGTWTVSDVRPGAPDGVDVLANIERLAFSDGGVDLGVPAHAASPHWTMEVSALAAFEPVSSPALPPVDPFSLF